MRIGTVLRLDFDVHLKVRQKHNYNLKETISVVWISFNVKSITESWLQTARTKSL